MQRLSNSGEPLPERSDEVRFSNLERAVLGLNEYVKELEKKLGNVEEELRGVKREFTEYKTAKPLAAMQLRMGTKPTHDFDIEHTKCCDRVTHYLDLIQNQSSRFWHFLNKLQARYSKVVDNDDKFVLDASGHTIDMPENACWIVKTLAQKSSYKFVHMYKYTCPKTDTVNVPLSMSVYKLIGISILPVEDHRVTLAIENKLEASHLCNSGPCVNPKHILLETATKNQRRKGHQNGWHPCDCTIPCIGPFVWSEGQKPALSALAQYKFAPNIVDDDSPEIDLEELLEEAMEERRAPEEKGEPTPKRQKQSASEIKEAKKAAKKAAQVEQEAENQKATLRKAVGGRKKYDWLT